jgi:hypothetical protein
MFRHAMFFQLKMLHLRGCTKYKWLLLGVLKSNELLLSVGCTGGTSLASCTLEFIRRYECILNTKYARYPEFIIFNQYMIKRSLYLFQQYYIKTCVKLSYLLIISSVCRSQYVWRRDPKASALFGLCFC